MKLSYIIPCYNVEKYIGECLDSLYNQDIAETDFEVICVNDCSPDNTRDVILDYQKQHNNLFLIEHQTNKMLGETRNTGLKEAKGKYVWFVDSDDFIEKNSVANLIKELENNDLDILNFELLRYYSESKIEKVDSLSEQTDVICGADFLRNLEHINSNGSVCRKIFKKEFLTDNNFKFPANIYYEDLLFSLLAVYYAKRFVYLPIYIYNYRYNPASILNASMDVVKFRSIFYNISEYFAFYEKIKDTDYKFAQRVKISALGDLDFVFKYITKFTNSQRKQATDYIEKYLPEINASGFFSGRKAIYFKHLKLSNAILTVAHPLFVLKRKMGRLKRKILNKKKN